MINRRNFVTAAAVAPFILPSRLRAQTVGANTKKTLAFIGMGIQSGGLMNHFRQQDDVQVVAVCDVDKTRREWAQKSINDYYTANPKKGSPVCRTFIDYKELLADKSIDLVCIATPDHWHAIITIDALKAGKDVYCEKPLTHNIAEVVAVMKAVEKYGRVLQTGSMQRSWGEFQTAVMLVRNGVIGKVSKVNCGFGGPARPCDLATEEMEPGLDWDRWLGPAPMRGYSSVLSPRGVCKHFPAWRRFREFATGSIGDIGAHHLDIAQWGMDKDATSPVLITPAANDKASIGGVMTYADGLEFHHGAKVAAHFVGTEGEVFVDRGRFALKIGDKFFSKFLNKEEDKDTSCERAYRMAQKEFLKDPKVQIYTGRDHMRNFLECVASRKKPCASEIAGGHTAILCHLLSQSYYHHQTMKWNPDKFEFTDGTGDPAWTTREYRDGYKLG